MPAPGPRSRGARVHPRSHQYFIQYCLRASAPLRRPRRQSRTASSGRRRRVGASGSRPRSSAASLERALSGLPPEPPDEQPPPTPPIGAEGGECPRCGTPYEPFQEYCLECGLRLPVSSGIIPVLATAWRRRVPWYPGDWIWPVLGALVVAALAAAVVILATTDNGSPTKTTAATGPPVPVGTGTIEPPPPAGTNTSSLPTPTIPATTETTARRSHRHHRPLRPR